MEGIEALNQNMVEIAERASKAVVSINSTLKIQSYGYGIAPVKGSGSGFIITPDGYVLTNNHVVEGSEEVEVILSDGSKYAGTVIGRDPQTDIAIVKLPGNGFPVLELGDSEEIKTGSLVLAIGNALGLPGGHTVSMGVISAKNRPMPWADFIFEGLLQTDAAINPGNSGGPLIDMSGKAIGINTAIIAQANGIGFSIPVNTVKKELHDMISTGKVNRKYIGISGIEMNSSIARRYGTGIDTGVMVARIDPYSPAYVSGIRPGDVIIEFDGKTVNSMRDLIKYVSEMSGSSDAVFMRGRSRYKTSITMKNKNGKRIIITD
jgi:serine protease Do